jgi:phthiocerol/phenolphthiocerol synthesis type-I polyketide synthase E
MAEPMLLQAFPPHAIAIVGLAGRFPGARDLDDFWRSMRDGVETLETLSDAELDAAGVPEALRSNPDFVRKGAALDGAELFDAGFFGYSPREAQIIDPQHRIFLECAWEALEHAGYAGGVSQKSVGVYAGASMNTYLPAQILHNPQLTEALGHYQLMLGNDKDFLCTRVSYKLDLHGPSMTIQTACSTSLVAVVVACRALSQGDCDLALAGGISVAFPQRTGYLYQEGMILSPDGHCRPFDADARGTRGGEGAGIVVLKRMADALADRDTIHAVIRGAAINNDGAGKAGYTAPSLDGQIETIAMAQTLAGIDPRTISYVEAHGTATPLGDPIEIAALTRVFRASTPDVGFCRLGSLKANIGHLDVAAGVAGLIKTVLALEHREIPPLVNFCTPNLRLDLDRSPFVASAQGCPWTTGGAPRRAGVSSMGIGGTNAHVVLEEAPHATPLTPHRYAHLLVLSAKTATALDRATSNLVECLDARDDLSLADVEWTLQVGRQDFAHRRMVVARAPPQAADLLRQPTRAPVLTGIHEGGPRPVAFLFSGQGSQYAGMGTGLYRTERVYREAIDRCAALLAPHLGMDIRKIILGDRGDSAINATRLTQPALFATEYALALLWMQWGITPTAMLGHSIGEYVAAHLAAVMSLEDVLAVVAARGRLMQELPPGAMAAVYLPAPELERWLEGGVEIAAINAPTLCTVSGPGEIIAKLVKRLEDGDVQATALHTSHAFHSAMMEPALASFTELLEGIALSLPTLPYVSNVTGTWITGEQATSPAYYATHLRRPIQFEAGIRTLAVDPALFLLEVGPGNALTSMARMTVGKNRAKHVFPSLPHAREQRADGEAMLEAAGCLWLSGAKVDWQRMHAGAGRRRVPLPTYPFERQRYWVEAAPATAPRSASDGQRLGASVDELLYAPSWMRDDSLASRSVRLQGNWLVLADRGLLADAVMGELRNVGAAPILVERGAEFQRLETSRFRVRPGVAEDIGALVRETGGLSGPIAGAIVLWSVMEPDTRATALAASPYSALIALSEGLETSASVSPLHVIAACVGAESVLDEPVLRPSTALAFGPVLVLPTEVQGLRMRSVDLDIREGTINIALAARALVEEAASHDTEVFVARRAGRRWVRRFERLDLPPVEATALPLKSRGTYLITGGLGGIGLKLATWLATVASARLLLTARTALPPRADWDAVLAQHGAGDRNAGVILAIKEIEQAGGEVVTAAADAADDSAMAAAIKEARTRWGALDGVIHAAGIAGHNKFAFRKNGQEVSAVLAPKVDGLDVLVRLLGDTPLDFVALMSSISSIVGKPGLCDYAAANSVLDAFAESALRPAVWRQVVALNWDAWRDVGMAARHVVPEAQRAEWQAYLQSSIVPAVGVEAFARVLASGRSRVIITPYDLVCGVERTRRQDSELATVSRSPDAAASELTSAVRARPALSSPFEAPGSEIERRLAAIWTELLGIDEIGAHDDFFDLGGHSLLATRVLARICERFGVRLALRDVFDAPTIHRLAERIDAAAPEAAVASHPPAEDREEMVF